MRNGIVGSSKTLPIIKLSPRQVEVVHLLSFGKSVRDIGKKLGISHKTVEKHIGIAYRKLGVKTAAHAFRCALEQQQITLQ